MKAEALEALTGAVFRGGSPRAAVAFRHSIARHQARLCQLYARVSLDK